MSLQLFLGSAGSGKSYQMYREVINQSECSKDTDFLVIVPEQFTLQTQKDIVSMHPNNGVMNVDILSFLRFAYRIFEEVGGNEYPVLEDTGKSMVIRKVVAEKKKELTLYGSNIRRAGFINELKSLLSEFYQYNIRAEDLEKMLRISAHKPLLKAKLRDIFVIYEGFKAFMQDRYITAEEIFTTLDSVIDRSEWLRGSIICLDGFTGFTPCQYQILTKMMKYAKKVMVTVTIDPREELEGPVAEHQLFGLSKKTVQKLYKIARDSNILIEPAVYAEQRRAEGEPFRFTNSKALCFLEQNLFRFPYDAYVNEQEDISLHSCKDAVAEIAFVSREIKRLVREEHYRYQDIAVVTGDIEQYGRIAKRILIESNIPCFIDYKKEILGNPFVELIRSAIAIVTEDFSYESVFRFLKTGLTKIAPVDIDLFENYILATGIRGNKQYQEMFSRQYKSKIKFDLGYINEIRQSLLSEIMPFFEAMKDKDNTVKDYTTALYELGVNMDIENKLFEYSKYFIEHNQPLKAKEYDQVYRIVMELYDQMVLLLGTEMCSLKEYGEIIETGFIEAKVGLIPPGVDEVVVGDTQRTRLKDIRALFFVGVNEGIVPMTISSGGILSDMERELLIQNDMELAPTRRQLAFTEQFYIYLNMTKPKERLYVTYHKVNMEGKSVNPSFMIAKLKQIFKELKEHNEEEGIEDVKHMLRDDGLSFLAKGLREYPNREISSLWKELFLYYKSREDKAKILGRLLMGAFYVNKESRISREAAQLLYGEELKGSVTRLERYASCAFAHFMSYGLTLEERREYKLAVPDIGNIFHNAIDYFSKRLKEEEYTWHNIPEDIRTDWAIQSVARAVEEYVSSGIKSTKRNEYLIKRIERITIRTLWALCNQIKQGSFEPVGYEMPFYHVPDAVLTLQGRIDRLDLYEEEDKVYVRVIDYKSGSTFFDYNNIYYGLSQQLAVYLSTAVDYLRNRYKEKEIIPSGIFYYHIDDPIVAKTDQAEEEIYKSLRMNGLVNEEKKVIALMDSKLAGPDGSLRASLKSDIIPIETNKEGELTKRSVTASEGQLKALMGYVNDKLVKDSNNILEGDTQLNPYQSGDKTACDYCEYKSACGFDTGLPGHMYRNLKKKSPEDIKEEIWGWELNDDNLDKRATKGN